MNRSLTRYRYRVTGRDGRPVIQGRRLRSSRLAASLAAVRSLGVILRRRQRAMTTTETCQDHFEINIDQVTIRPSTPPGPPPPLSHNVSARERTLLFNCILESKYLDELEIKVNQLCNAACYGCEVDHPSQVQHQCLMMSDEEKVDWYFEEALTEMPHDLILARAKERLSPTGLEIPDVDRYENINYLHNNFFTEARKAELTFRLKEKMKET